MNMDLRWLFGMMAVIAAAEPPASRLGSTLAELSTLQEQPSEPPVPEVSDVSSEVAEVSRLERLPAVAIPIQDETLAGAITTIATASGMNFIAPATEQFPDRVTLTTKVTPWRLLNRLGDRYGFTMRYRDGIWEFNRESAGAIIARVYYLKHTNLDVFKATQNSFATINSVTNGSANAGTGGDGGRVFSAETQKIIDDVRELIGVPAQRVVADAMSDTADKSSAVRREPSPDKHSAKVLYVPDVNALYVACERAQHDLVAGYLGVVDRPPRQVRIEARFFETSWDPKTVLGINPENFQPRVSLANVRGTLDLSTLSTHGEKAVLSMDDVSLQVSALRSDQQSRLVQNPTVVTANNREVYFSVGDEEPFVSSNNIYPGVPNGGFGSTTASVSVRRIGTSVNVVPTVFEGEGAGKRRIRLVVRIEVGALKGFRQVNAINIPVVSSQKYEYTTYVDDNQALAFGGLSGIGETDAVKKVPIAGDVPGVGYLFKSKSREVHQRNLVAYIIARTVDTADETQMPVVPLRTPGSESRLFPH